MLKLRLLTVAVVLPLFLAALFMLPNLWWSAAMLLLLLVAAHEWSRLSAFSRAGEAAFVTVIALGCVLLWLTGSASARLGSVPLATDRAVFALSVAFWCVIAPCWLWLKLAVRNRALLGLAGVVVLVPTWLALTRLQSDALLLLLLLGVVWIADTAAYFSGRALGRHKLAPAISPGKTWEGVAGAFVAVGLYAVIVHLWLRPTQDLSAVVLGFLAMTALSIVGDLFESWLKRRAGVKDSGELFPGHGGMLDRIDGMTAALPAAALVFI